MSALTETELVEAVRQGRREGQTEMVSRYAERVFAMIARQVPDMMDAQELTQDTFLRAFSHIDSYAPHKASLSTWLCRIAYHLTLDHLKRRRPVIVVMEDNTDISDEELEAELSTGREERIEQLMEVIDDALLLRRPSARRDNLYHRYRTCSTGQPPLQDEKETLSQVK